MGPTGQERSTLTLRVQITRSLARMTAARRDRNKVKVTIIHVLCVKAVLFSACSDGNKTSSQPTTLSLPPHSDRTIIPRPLYLCRSPSRPRVSFRSNESVSFVRARPRLSGFASPRVVVFCFRPSAYAARCRPLITSQLSAVCSCSHILVADDVPVVVAANSDRPATTETHPPGLPTLCNRLGDAAARAYTVDDYVRSAGDWVCKTFRRINAMSRAYNDIPYIGVFDSDNRFSLRIHVL